MRRLPVLLVLPLLAVLAGCGDDDDGGGAAVGNFCDRAELVDQRFNELESQFEGTDLPTVEVFEEAADSIDELAADAPDEIDDDLQTVADGVREIAAVFGEIDFSDPDALADPENAEALQEMGERMESIGSEVEEASDRVSTYLEEECGIQIDGDDEE